MVIPRSYALYLVVSILLIGEVYDTDLPTQRNDAAEADLASSKHSKALAGDKSQISIRGSAEKSDSNQKKSDQKNDRDMKTLPSDKEPSKMTAEGSSGGRSSLKGDNKDGREQSQNKRFSAETSFGSREDSSAEESHSAEKNGKNHVAAPALSLGGYSGAGLGQDDIEPPPNRRRSTSKKPSSNEQSTHNQMSSTLPTALVVGIALNKDSSLTPKSSITATSITSPAASNSQDILLSTKKVQGSTTIKNETTTSSPVITTTNNAISPSKMQSTSAKSNPTSFTPSQSTTSNHHKDITTKTVTSSTAVPVGSASKQATSSTTKVVFSTTVPTGGTLKQVQVVSTIQDSSTIRRVASSTSVPTGSTTRHDTSSTYQGSSTNKVSSSATAPTGSASSTGTARRSQGTASSNGSAVASSQGSSTNIISSTTSAPTRHATNSIFVSTGSELKHATSSPPQGRSTNRMTSSNFAPTSDTSRHATSSTSKISSTNTRSSSTSAPTISTTRHQDSSTNRAASSTSVLTGNTLRHVTSSTSQGRSTNTVSSSTSVPNGNTLRQANSSVSQGSSATKVSSSSSATSSIFQSSSTNKQSSSASRYTTSGMISSSSHRIASATSVPTGSISRQTTFGSSQGSTNRIAFSTSPTGSTAENVIHSSSQSSSTDKMASYTTVSNDSTSRQATSGPSQGNTTNKMASSTSALTGSSSRDVTSSTSQSSSTNRIPSIFSTPTGSISRTSQGSITNKVSASTSLSNGSTLRQTTSGPSQGGSTGRAASSTSIPTISISKQSTFGPSQGSSTNRMASSTSFPIVSTSRQATFGHTQGSSTNRRTSSTSAPTYSSPRHVTYSTSHGSSPNRFSLFSSPQTGNISHTTQGSITNKVSSSTSVPNGSTLRQATSGSAQGGSISKASSINSIPTVSTSRQATFGPSQRNSTNILASSASTPTGKTAEHVIRSSSQGSSTVKMASSTIVPNGSTSRKATSGPSQDSSTNRMTSSTSHVTSSTLQGSTTNRVSSYSSSPTGSISHTVQGSIINITSASTSVPNGSTLRQTSSGSSQSGSISRASSTNSIPTASTSKQATFDPSQGSSTIRIAPSTSTPTVSSPRHVTSSTLQGSTTNRVSSFSSAPTGSTSHTTQGSTTNKTSASTSVPNGSTLRQTTSGSSQGGSFSRASSTNSIPNVSTSRQATFGPSQVHSTNRMASPTSASTGSSPRYAASSTSQGSVTNKAAPSTSSPMVNTARQVTSGPSQNSNTSRAASSTSIPGGSTVKEINYTITQGSSTNKVTFSTSHGSSTNRATPSATSPTGNTSRQTTLSTSKGSSTNRVSFSSSIPTVSTSRPASSFPTQSSSTNRRASSASVTATSTSKQDKSSTYEGSSTNRNASSKGSTSIPATTSNQSSQSTTFSTLQGDKTSSKVMSSTSMPTTHVTSKELFTSTMHGSASNKITLTSSFGGINPTTHVSNSVTTISPISGSITATSPKGTNYGSRTASHLSTNSTTRTTFSGKLSPTAVHGLSTISSPSSLTFTKVSSTSSSRHPIATTPKPNNVTRSPPIRCNTNEALCLRTGKCISSLQYFDLERRTWQCDRMICGDDEVLCANCGTCQRTTKHFRELHGVICSFDEVFCLQSAKCIKCSDNEKGVAPPPPSTISPVHDPEGDHLMCPKGEISPIPLNIYCRNNSDCPLNASCCYLSNEERHLLPYCVWSSPQGQCSPYHYYCKVTGQCQLPNMPCNNTCPNSLQFCEAINQCLEPGVCQNYSRNATLEPFDLPNDLYPTINITQIKPVAEDSDVIFRVSNFFAIAGLHDYRMELKERILRRFLSEYLAWEVRTSYYHEWIRKLSAFLSVKGQIVELSSAEAIDTRGLPVQPGAAFPCSDGISLTVTDRQLNKHYCGADHAPLKLRETVSMKTPRDFAGNVTLGVTAVVSDINGRRYRGPRQMLTINLLPINDPPHARWSMMDADEEPPIPAILRNVGATVGELVGTYFQDPESDCLGMAVLTAQDSLFGFWQYQLPGSNQWTNITDVDSSCSLLHELGLSSERRGIVYPDGSLSTVGETIGAVPEPLEQHRRIRRAITFYDTNTNVTSDRNSSLTSPSSLANKSWSSQTNRWAHPELAPHFSEDYLILTKLATGSSPLIFESIDNDVVNWTSVDLQMPWRNRTRVVHQLKPCPDHHLENPLFPVTSTTVRTITTPGLTNFVTSTLASLRLSSYNSFKSTMTTLSHVTFDGAGTYSTSTEFRSGSPSRQSGSTGHIPISTTASQSMATAKSTSSPTARGSSPKPENISTTRMSQTMAPGTAGSSGGTLITSPTGTNGPSTGHTNSNSVTLTTNAGAGTTSAETGATNIGTGSTSVGSGSSTIKTGSTNAEIGSTNIGIGSTTIRTGSTNIETGPTTFRTGSTTIRTGPTSNGSGPTSNRSGATPVRTGSTNIEAGPTTIRIGSTTSRTGPTSHGSGPTNNTSGPTSNRSGATTIKTGSTNIGTGPTTFRTGSTTIRTGPTSNESGPTNNTSGPTSNRSGATTVKTGSTNIGTGPTSTGSGTTTTRTGTGFSSTTTKYSSTTRTTTPTTTTTVPPTAPPVDLNSVSQQYTQTIKANVKALFLPCKAKLRFVRKESVWYTFTEALNSMKLAFAAWDESDNRTGGVKENVTLELCTVQSKIPNCGRNGSLSSQLAVIHGGSDDCNGQMSLTTKSLRPTCDTRKFENGHSRCLDCNRVLDGDAFMNCGVCVEGDTQISFRSYLDCSGQCTRMGANTVTLYKNGETVCQHKMDRVLQRPCASVNFNSTKDHCGECVSAQDEEATGSICNHCPKAENFGIITSLHAHFDCEFNWDPDNVLEVLAYGPFPFLQWETVPGSWHAFYVDFASLASELEPVELRVYGPSWSHQNEAFVNVTCKLLTSKGENVPQAELYALLMADHLRLLLDYRVTGNYRVACRMYTRFDPNYYHSLSPIAKLGLVDSRHLVVNSVTSVRIGNQNFTQKITVVGGHFVNASSMSCVYFLQNSQRAQALSPATYINATHVTCMVPLKELPMKHIIIEVGVIITPRVLTAYYQDERWILSKATLELQGNGGARLVSADIVPYSSNWALELFFDCQLEETLDNCQDIFTEFLSFFHRNASCKVRGNKITIWLMDITTLSSPTKRIVMTPYNSVFCISAPGSAPPASGNELPIINSGRSKSASLSPSFNMIGPTMACQDQVSFKITDFKVDSQCIIVRWDIELVSPGQGNIQHLKAVANNLHYQSLEFNLSTSILPPKAVFRTSAQITDCINQQTLRVRQFQFNASNPAEITLYAPSQIKSHNHLYVEAIVNLCRASRFSKRPKFSFYWEVEGINLDLRNVRSRRLSIGKNMLSEGRSYTVRCLVIINDDPKMSVWSETVVEVVSDGPYALTTVIALRVPVTRPLQIDGRPSNHGFGRNKLPLRFSWSCNTPHGGGCYVFNYTTTHRLETLLGDDIFLPVLNVAANTLDIGNYTFKLTVSTVDGKESSTSVSVSILPATDERAPLLTVIPSSPLFISSEHGVPQRALVSAPAGTEVWWMRAPDSLLDPSWSAGWYNALSGDTERLAVSANLFNSRGRIGQSKDAAWRNWPLPYEQQAVRVMATHPLYGTTFADVVITSTPLPVQSFRVTPREGYGIQQIFSIEINVDYNADPGSSTRLGFRIRKDPERRIEYLRTFAGSGPNPHTFRLPAVDTMVGDVIVVAKTCNSYGACVVTESLPILVKPPRIANESDVLILIDTVQEMLDTGDMEGAMLLARSCLQTLSYGRVTRGALVESITRTLETTVRRLAAQLRSQIKRLASSQFEAFESLDSILSALRDVAPTHHTVASLFSLRAVIFDTFIKRHQLQKYNETQQLTTPKRELTNTTTNKTPKGTTNKTPKGITKKAHAETTKIQTGTTKFSNGTTKPSNGTTKSTTGTIKISTGTTKAHTGITKTPTGTTKTSNGRSTTKYFTGTTNKTTTGTTNKVYPETTKIHTGTTKPPTGTNKLSTGTTKPYTGTTKTNKAPTDATNKVYTGTAKPSNGTAKPSNTTTKLHTETTKLLTGTSKTIPLTSKPPSKTITTSTETTKHHTGSTNKVATITPKPSNESTRTRSTNIPSGSTNKVSTAFTNRPTATSRKPFTGTTKPIPIEFRNGSTTPTKVSTTFTRGSTASIKRSTGFTNMPTRHTTKMHTGSTSKLTTTHGLPAGSRGKRRAKSGGRGHSSSSSSSSSNSSPRKSSKRDDGGGSNYQSKQEVVVRSKPQTKTSLTEKSNPIYHNSPSADKQPRVAIRNPSQDGGFNSRPGNSRRVQKQRFHSGMGTPNYRHSPNLNDRAGFGGNQPFVLGLRSRYVDERSSFRRRTRRKTNTRTASQGPSRNVTSGNSANFNFTYEERHRVQVFEPIDPIGWHQAQSILEVADLVLKHFIEYRAALFSELLDQLPDMIAALCRGVSATYDPVVSSSRIAVLQVGQIEANLISGRGFPFINTLSNHQRFNNVTSFFRFSSDDLGDLANEAQCEYEEPDCGVVCLGSAHFGADVLSQAFRENSVTEQFRRSDVLGLWPTLRTDVEDVDILMMISEVELDIGICRNCATHEEISYLKCAAFNEEYWDTSICDTTAIVVSPGEITARCHCPPLGFYSLYVDYDLPPLEFEMQAAPVHVPTRPLPDWTRVNRTSNSSRGGASGGDGSMTSVPTSSSAHLDGKFHISFSFDGEYHKIVINKPNFLGLMHSQLLAMFNVVPSTFTNMDARPGSVVVEMTVTPDPNSKYNTAPLMMNAIEQSIASGKFCFRDERQEVICANPGSLQGGNGQSVVTQNHSMIGTVVGVVVAIVVLVVALCVIRALYRERQRRNKIRAAQVTAPPSYRPLNEAPMSPATLARMPQLLEGTIDSREHYRLRLEGGQVADLKVSAPPGNHSTPPTVKQVHVRPTSALPGEVEQSLYTTNDLPNPTGAPLATSGDKARSKSKEAAAKPDSNEDKKSHASEGAKESKENKEPHFKSNNKEPEAQQKGKEPKKTDSLGEAGSSNPTIQEKTNKKGKANLDKLVYSDS